MNVAGCVKVYVRARRKKSKPILLPNFSENRKTIYFFDQRILKNNVFKLKSHRKNLNVFLHYNLSHKFFSVNFKTKKIMKKN